MEGLFQLQFKPPSVTEMLSSVKISVLDEYLRSINLTHLRCELEIRQINKPMVEPIISLIKSKVMLLDGTTVPEQNISWKWCKITHLPNPENSTTLSQKIINILEFCNLKVSKPCQGT